MRPALLRTLRDLGTPYLDLYLVRAPRPRGRGEEGGGGGRGEGTGQHPLINTRSRVDWG